MSDIASSYETIVNLESEGKKNLFAQTLAYGEDYIEKYISKMIIKAKTVSC